tara:strand:- start:51 stop:563 length:513 start_codon:yes stop_codon:yes gene_type:complete
MSIVDNAQYFAIAAHGAIGQKRKYSNDDYIVHPQRVAKIVETYGGTNSMIAAAWLHDVLEDTQVSYDTMYDVFGSVITGMVVGLTDVSVPSDGNRKARKNLDRLHTANATADSQFIKCADIMDNAFDIYDCDPNFWKVYKAEMLMVLDVMRKEVKEKTIWKRALEVVERI